MPERQTKRRVSPEPRPDAQRLSHCKLCLKTPLYVCCYGHATDIICPLCLGYAHFLGATGGHEYGMRLIRTATQYLAHRMWGGRSVRIDRDRNAA